MQTFAGRQTLDGPPALVSSVSHQPALDRVTVLANPLITAGPLTDLANWSCEIFLFGVRNPTSILLVGNNIRLINPTWGAGTTVIRCTYLGGPPFYTTDDFGTLQPFDVAVPFP